MIITIMIDTVVLQYLLGKYKVVESKKFSPPFAPINCLNNAERSRFLQDYRGHREYKLNPSSALREQGLVYPNLTIAERIDIRTGIYTCNLKVSLSLPKLLWGHSFQEATDSMFLSVVSVLVERLRMMNIVVTEEDTKSAIVQTLHFCANIMFSSLEEARLLLSRLFKCSFNQWFENNTKTFSNDGVAVRFHTNVFEIVFYLKYYDVLEKKDRSIDRRKTLQEKEIAKKVFEEGKIPPLVRMEIRFNGKRYVRSHLNASLGIDKPLWTFQDVFDSSKSRKSLKYYWDKIIYDPINHSILATTTDEDVCQKVLNKFKGERLKNIFDSVGLFYFVKNLGVKGVREIVVLRHNRKTWYDKRKKIIAFARRFVKSDDTLIKIVTEVLENKPRQLRLPL